MAGEVVRDIRVVVCVRQEAEGFRCAQGVDETPGFGKGERASKDRAMGGNAQELINDRSWGELSAPV